MWSRVGGLFVLWAMGAVLLWWPRLSGPWRRRAALLWGLGGLVALVAALNTEGSRESPTVAVFLMGTPYVTATASASASLPYYLLSGVFLLLGFAGLALGDEGASWLSRHWLAGAIGLSLAITALRFALEKTAAPPFLTQLVGVTWLAPVVGAVFFLNSRKDGGGALSLVRALVVYAVAVRVAIALLMLVATTRHLGSHYDVSPLTLVRNPLTGEAHTFVAGSVPQLVSLVLIPQLGVWPLFTVLVGLVGAAVAVVAAPPWRPPKLPTRPPAAAGAPAVRSEPS